MDAFVRLLRVLNLAAAVWLGSGAAVGWADLIADVSFPTWPGSLTPGASLSLLFELTDGSGLGDGNNIVTVSAFDLGGGTPGPVSTTGGGSAMLSPLQVILTDPAFDNTVTLPFTAGTGLSFILALTTNADGQQPDQLSVYVLDSLGAPFPTSDPLGANAFLALDIVPGVSLLDIQTFTSLDPPGLGAPLVQAPPPIAIPQPGAIVFSLVGLAALVTGRLAGLGPSVRGEHARSWPPGRCAHRGARRSARAV